MKKLLSSILAVILLLSVLTVPAYAANSLPFTDEDYLREDFGPADYKKYNTGSVNNKCVTWPEGTLVASGDYYNGNYVGYNEDYDDTATDINFPTSVVIIPMLALNNHKSVERVNWEELVNLKFIDSGSVGYTKISTLDLRNTKVVRIGDAAFSNSNNLTTFKSPVTLKRIDDHAFEGCLRITTLELNEGLEYIGESAFGSGYGYNNVIIPSTVTYIGAGGLRTDKTYRVYKGSYGEQWCKDNNVKYTYVDGSSVDNSSSSANGSTTTPSSVPTMAHTKTIGGVTFSNYVSHREMTNYDYYKNEIPVTVVTLGPDACMRADADNTDFILWYSGKWNCDGKDGNAGGHTAAIYTDKGCWNGDYRTETLDMRGVTAYPSTKNNSGTWSKGLTWQFSYKKDTYDITVTQNGVNKYFMLIMQENPTYPQEKLPDIQQQQPTQSATANPNNSKVLVNGKTVAFDSYNINNNNYFKLRDIAQVLRGTDKQFEVVWDSTRNAINMTSNKPYTTVGGELKVGDGVAKQCTLNSSPIYKDGVQVSLTAYTINGNNYFKLRDLGALIGFDVSWDSTQGAVVIDTTKPYDANT